MRSAITKQIQIETKEDSKIFAKKYADIILRINFLLKEKGYTQKHLAEKLDKNPSEISKWLNGDHNFTLRSIAKLEAELGDVIIYIPETKIVKKQENTEKQKSIRQKEPLPNRNTIGHRI